MVKKALPEPVIPQVAPAMLDIREEAPAEAVEVELDVEAKPQPKLTNETRVTDEMNVVELDDGSAEVEMSVEVPRQNVDFDANLAETLDRAELDKISTYFLDCIDRDKDARKKRDEQYAEGIKRTGLGNEAPGGAEFTGASKAVHPVLVEACIDFSARAMKELFPSRGPVKTHIVGKATSEKMEKAERKKTYMNWQLTKQISEYRPGLEQLLTQLPLGGSQYQKWWRDSSRQRNRAEFVPIDDVYLPYACTDFYTSERVTHVQHLTQLEFEDRVASGLYTRRVPINDASGMIPDQTEAAQATDKVEGREEDAYNTDGLRNVFEIHAFHRIEGDEESDLDKPAAPYVISIDENSRKVVGVYRNWNPNDKLQQKLDWMVEYPLIPWRGAYAIGLAQAVGSLSGAATGALRALLDSAHIQNFPAAIKLKGGRIAGQTVQVEATGITEIEGPTGLDDIRKLAMPLPYPGPSSTLFQLLQFCVEAARGVITTADEKIADTNSNSPVGTTLALIEQGSITFSAVHARLHFAQAKTLSILHRLNAEYLSDEEVVEDLGELVVRRSDFEGPMDVQPVSDPNIFSDTQRYAQQQAVLQLKTMFPQAFKDGALVERTLKLLGYPDYEEVMNLPSAPEFRAPVDENICARDPLKQIKVYDEDDHLVHLKVHVQFLTSPLLCANPMMANPAMPVLIAHCAEHIAYMYKEHAKASVAAAEAVALAMGKEADVEGLRLAERELATEIGPIMDHLTQAAEMVKTLIPPPPASEAVQVAQLQLQAVQARETARVQSDTQVAQTKETGAMQREQAKQVGETQRDQMEYAFEKELVAAEQRFSAIVMAATQKFEDAQSNKQLAFGTRNADIAEASERRAQDKQQIIAEIREAEATARAADQAKYDERLLVLEKMLEKVFPPPVKPAQPGESNGSDK